MKAYLLSILKVLVIALIAYLGVSTLIAVTGTETYVGTVYNAEGGYGYTQVRLQEADTAKADIVVLGSSHAYEGFSPIEFAQRDYNLFNLGSSAQTPIGSYYLLKRYAPRLQPKRVIMEVYWETVAVDVPLESTVDLISNDELDGTSAMMSLTTKDPRIINTFVTQYIKQLLGLEENPQKDIEGQTYISRGFVEKKGTVTQEKLAQIQSYETKVDSAQLDALRDIISYCKSNEIELVFVRTPVTKSYFDALTNYWIVVTPVTEICNSNNINLIDFNIDYPAYPNEYFADKNHLNRTGVKAFNADLIAELESIGFLDPFE